MAQTPSSFLRGVITTISDDSMTVKSYDGKTQSVALAKDLKISLLKPLDVAMIKPGSFVGTAEMPQADGTGRSLEVHVFPPGVKAGEGHRDWDLQKGSKMTNGTVGKVVASAKGRELEITYPTGQRRIVIPPNVPIVEITTGERAQLKTGIPIFAMIAKAADGSAIINSVSIGENGAKPPM